ncbi:hypothetical protein GPALN_009746 [Globodera pallida]|nr:hypothetical protein GPALN_009746 [Globodera pallida]
MVYRMLCQSARVICVNCLQQGKPTCYYEEALRRLNAIGRLNQSPVTNKRLLLISRRNMVLWAEMRGGRRLKAVWSCDTGASFGSQCIFLGEHSNSHRSTHMFCCLNTILAPPQASPLSSGVASLDLLSRLDSGLKGRKRNFGKSAFQKFLSTEMSRCTSRWRRHQFGHCLLKDTWCCAQSAL